MLNNLMNLNVGELVAHYDLQATALSKLVGRSRYYLSRKHQRSIKITVAQQHEIVNKLKNYYEKQLDRVREHQFKLTDVK